MIKNIRKYENLHIVFWLVKDTCWCLSFKTLGMIMIFPTLFVALDLMWRSRREPDNFYHNIAIALWIGANATWMTGEFFFNDKSRPYAMGFFISGLVVIAYYYIFVAKYGKEAEL